MYFLDCKFINIITFGLVYIISLIIIIGVYQKRIENASKKNMDEEEIEFMQDILDLCVNNKSNFDLIETADNICETIKEYYKIDYCTLLINKDDKLKILSSNIEKFLIEGLEKFCNEEIKRMSFNASVKTCVQGLDYFSAEKRDIKYSYLMPFKNGALLLENKTPCENEFEKQFFTIVIKNISMVLQTCNYHKKIKDLAMTDNLTKVFNRNYMQFDLEKKMSEKKFFSLAIMDIDYFKKINDNYGHDFGDIVLKKVSNFVKSNIRGYDEIYRWGGEEFIIYFEASDKRAVDRLNQIRNMLSKYKISKGDINISITASFGVVSSTRANNIDELINYADKALYLSKKGGRNKVTLYK